jgi:hypothetical protein
LHDRVITLGSSRKIDLTVAIVDPTGAPIGIFAIGNDSIIALFSVIDHSDAPRMNADQVFAPAYFGKMGGGKALRFGVGMMAFPRFITSWSARRSAPVFAAGTTATGSQLI